MDGYMLACPDVVACMYSMYVQHVCMYICGRASDRIGSIPSFVPPSILFASLPPAASRGSNSAAVFISLHATVVFVVVDPRRSIDSKYPDTVHNGQLPSHLNNPQDDVRHANIEGIV